MKDTTRRIPRKTMLNEEEDLAVRRACSVVGAGYSPVTRLLLLQFVAQVNGTPEPVQKKWPKHGHVSIPRCPGRRASAHVHKRL